MLITTLGTSHGDHTYCRFNSSTLVETAGRSYLVDAGAPVEALMIRAGKTFAELKAVFVTHLHGDHVFGLPGLIKALIKHGESGQHTDIFLPEAEALPALESWLQATRLPWPSVFVTLKTTRPGVIYDDGTLEARAIATRHLRHPEHPVTFAYRFAGDGKRVVFTGDLSADFSDFPEIVRQEPCDLCLCEAQHYSPEAALPILRKCPLQRLVFSHLANEWHGEGEKRLLEIYADLPYPVSVAHDGDAFEV